MARASDAWTVEVPESTSTHHPSHAGRLTSTGSVLVGPGASVELRVRPTIGRDLRVRTAPAHPPVSTSVAG